MATFTLPILFKKSSKGKIQTWQATVVGNVISIEHGQKDGKKQCDQKTIEKGKNIGKANETTPEEQAKFEAESKWNKQLDKGYVQDIREVDKVVYLPMLAHPYDKRKKHIVYPAVAQRKFDGVRCLANCVDGKTTLLSRKGKEFPHMEHIKRQIAFMANNQPIYIDGELYCEDDFEELVGLVKRETLKDGDEERMKRFKLRVYDCILVDDPETDYIDRYNTVKALIEGTRCSNIEIVENFTVENEEEAIKMHDQFVSEGYEGLILRNFKGAYGVNKRSNDLQKYKNFIDDEFEIVGHKQASGRDEGTVIWTCVTKNGTEFDVRPRGSREARAEWFNNGKKYHGQNLTVRYQEETKYGVPRFPVGIAIRDYE